MQTERLGWAGNLAAIESNLDRHCVVTQAYPLGYPLGHTPPWAKGSIAWVEKNKAFIAFERGDHLFPKVVGEETPKEPISKEPALKEPALLKVTDKKSQFFGHIHHAGSDNGWWSEHEVRRNIEEGWLAPVDPMTEPLMVGDTVQVVFERSPFKGKIGKITHINQGCVVVEGCTETGAGWKHRSSLKLISRGGF